MHIFLGARRRKKERKKHKDHKCAWLSALHWRRWCNVASEKTFKNHTRLNSIWELLVKRWYFFFLFTEEMCKVSHKQLAVFFCFFFFLQITFYNNIKLFPVFWKTEGMVHVSVGEDAALWLMVLDCCWQPQLCWPTAANRPRMSSHVCNTSAHTDAVCRGLSLKDIKT